VNLKQDLAGKQVLVTGGAGFIGSNLCEYLLNSGAYVKCLDNLSTGHKKNISSFMSHKSFSFLFGSITDLDTCQKACENIDYVLHQAALGSVPRSIEHPSKTNNVNVNGFLNMLIASKDNNVKRFVYASSSSIYGDSPKLPKTENEIGAPLSPYAITKYTNELYASIFKKHYNLDTIGLRYFNVFGQKQDPDGAYAAVIPLFIKLLLQHKSPYINGDGSFSRDFTYIKNVVQMNVLAMICKNKNAINQLYNVAVGDSTTINELFFIIRKYLAKYDKKISSIKPKYRKIRDGDVPHSKACIKKAQKFFGYNPTHNLEIGIKESIDWYYKELNLKNETK